MADFYELYLAISFLLSGLFVTMIGFNLIKFKARNPDGEERMIIWQKKSGKMTRILGIFIILGGIFLFFLSTNEIKRNKWSQSDKDVIKNQLIRSAPFLQNFSVDIQDSILTCFIEKYTHTYTLKESLTHAKWTEEQKLEVTIPMMRDCLERFGLLKVD